MDRREEMAQEARLNSTGHPAKVPTICCKLQRITATYRVSSQSRQDSKPPSSHFMSISGLAPTTPLSPPSVHPHLQLHLLAPAALMHDEELSHSVPILFLPPFNPSSSTNRSSDGFTPIICLSSSHGLAKCDGPIRADPLHRLSFSEGVDLNGPCTVVARRPLLPGLADDFIQQDDKLHS